MEIILDDSIVCMMFNSTYSLVIREPSSSKKSRKTNQVSSSAITILFNKFREICGRKSCSVFARVFEEGRKIITANLLAC
jgi:hypothetical protein